MTDPQSNRQAVENLFLEHAGAIFALGKRMCSTADDAEDLVQETFLSAQRSWHTFEGRSSPRTWLWTIALHACQRMSRKKAGEPTHLESYEDLLPSGELQIPLLDSGDINALDRLIQREIQANVEVAIAELPHTFRVPLVLKDIAELSIAEIASILGIEINTAKTRIHRARLKLRRAVAEALPKSDAPEPDHSKAVCLTLLAAKQEALDRGVDFEPAQDELCYRCRSLFDTLDLSQDACARIRTGTPLPASISKMLNASK